jgi:plastocyanin
VIFRFGRTAARKRISPYNARWKTMKIAAVFAGLCLALLSAILPLEVARAAEVEVEIVEPGDLDTWRFSPAVVSVPAGSTVTWRNLGRQAHSVTSQDQLFDSRLLDPGKTWSYTFTTPGTYRYFCVPSPWLKGMVVVTAAEPERRASEGSDERTPRPTPTSEPTPRPSSADQGEPAATPTATPNGTPGRPRTPLPAPSEAGEGD